MAIFHYLDKENMRSTSKQLFIESLSITGYFLLSMLLPFAALSIDIFYLQNIVAEASAVEYSQDLFLFLLCILFAIQAHKKPHFRSGFILMSCFFLTMLIREADNFFDNMLYHGAWKLFALPVATFAVIYALLNYEQTINSLNHFTQSKPFFSFIIGLLLVLVASRLIGMNNIWVHILDNDYPRIVKHIAEEYSELLGYSVMCFSSFK